MQLRVRRRVAGGLKQRHEDVVQHLLEVLDDALLLVHGVQARDLRRQGLSSERGFNPGFTAIQGPAARNEQRASRSNATWHAKSAAESLLIEPMLHPP